MSRRNALDQNELKHLFAETPDSFRRMVERTVQDVPRRPQVPARKPLRLGLVLALVLVLCLAAAAVAAVLHPTADVFGFLFGSKRQEELLLGDAARMDRTLTLDQAVITLEEVVFEQRDGLGGIYATGLITPREGYVVIPEEYGPDTPAGFLVFYGHKEDIPADAPTYADLARARNADMVIARVLIDSVLSGDAVVSEESGYSLLPQPDGSVRFALEAGGTMQRAEEYGLRLYIGIQPVDEQGVTGDIQRHDWQLRVRPDLDATAKAGIAAQTLPPAPTQAPPVPDNALRVVNASWDVKVWQATHPERPAADVSTGEADMAAWLSDKHNDWDVAFLWLNETDVAGMHEAGILLDLAGDEHLQSAVGRMIAPVRDAVTAEGRIYALPTAMFAWDNPLARARDDVWAQLGWGDAEIPATFADWCALAETYMNLPPETRQGTRFVEGESQVAVRRLFLSRLIVLQLAEIQTGSETSFDTPAFREGLQQLERAAHALSGPQAPRGERNTWLVFHDAGPSLTAEGAVPMKLTHDPVFPQRVEVCVVNAHSPRLADALSFMRWRADNMPGQFLELMDAEMPAKEIGRLALAHDIQARAAFDSAHEGLAELRDKLNRGDTAAYAPDANLLAAYRARWVPAIRVPHNVPFINTHAPAEQYLAGELDADGLVRALDAAITQK